MNYVAQTLFFALSISVFNTVYIATGQARFTKVPPSVLYESVGKTARFVWDYAVGDRTKDFQENSPKWSFYGPNNSESTIGYELVFEQRKWTINHKTCPKRLLYPTRVSLESNATLVIENVTEADSGTYGCSLELTTRHPIISKVKLVVTISTASPSINRENGKKPTTYRETATVTKQVSTESKSSNKNRKNGNDLTTYIGTTTVATQVSTQAAIPSRKKRKSITPMVGGIIGVGLLIGIAIGLALFVIAKKTCMSKKKPDKSKKNCKESSRNTRSQSVIEGTFESEIPIYAEIDSSMKNRLDKENVVPIYAQVDKSKKKRPGQIIYTELEDLKGFEEMSSKIVPPEYTGTEYADIQDLSSQKNNESIYERL